MSIVVPVNSRSGPVMHEVVVGIGIGWPSAVAGVATGVSDSAATAVGVSRCCSVDVVTFYAGYGCSDATASRY